MILPQAGRQEAGDKVPEAAHQRCEQEVVVGEVVVEHALGGVGGQGDVAGCDGGYLAFRKQPLGNVDQVLPERGGRVADGVAERPGAPRRHENESVSVCSWNGALHLTRDLLTGGTSTTDVTVRVPGGVWGGVQAGAGALCL